MKRIGNLFESVVDRDNLRRAVGKAMRGKRERPEVMAFLHNLDARLAAMAEQLQAGTFPLGTYRQFLLFDPKERIITAPVLRRACAAPRRDERVRAGLRAWLIADTACRKGKSRLAALERRAASRRYPFYLKLDIRKYFDSVPHDRLVPKLARVFKVIRVSNRVLRWKTAKCCTGYVGGRLVNEKGQCTPTSTSGRATPGVIIIRQ